MVALFHGDPVCRRFPPFGASYHLIVPLQLEAVKVNVPGEHDEAGEAEGIGGVGPEPVTCKVATLVLGNGAQPFEVTSSLK
jgi:hypothetical protein